MSEDQLYLEALLRAKRAFRKYFIFSVLGFIFVILLSISIIDDLWRIAFYRLNPNGITGSKLLLFLVFGFVYWSYWDYYGNFRNFIITKGKKLPGSFYELLRRRQEEIDKRDRARVAEDLRIEQEKEKQFQASVENALKRRDQV